MKVKFYPDNISFEVVEGTKLIDVAKENNINISDEPCGNGVCGKCKVIIKEGNNTPLTFKERNILSEEEKNIVRRGRNTENHHIPKNSSVEEYAYSTAFEALIGYLYLTKNINRVKEVIEAVINNINSVEK